MHPVMKHLAIPWSAISEEQEIPLTLFYYILIVRLKPRLSTLSFATNFDIGDGPSIIEENGQSYVMLVATSPTTGLILHRPERPYNDDDSCRILLAATPGYQSRVSLNTFPLPKNQHTLTLNSFIMTTGHLSTFLIPLLVPVIWEKIHYSQIYIFRRRQTQRIGMDDWTARPYG